MIENRVFVFGLMLLLLSACDASDQSAERQLGRSQDTQDNLKVTTDKQNARDRSQPPEDQSARDRSQPLEDQAVLTTHYKSIDSVTIDSTSEDKEDKIQLPVNSAEPSSLNGIFRCWSYNVGGAGKSCTSPPIVLLADGTYTMSKENGTYIIREDEIILSESKIRGRGRIIENGNQLRFQYIYNGLEHTVTYVRFGDASGSGDEKYVEVYLTLVFPYDSSGINTVSLIEYGLQDPSAETLAYEVAPNVVEAVFRKTQTKSGVATGKIYDILVSSGFSSWKVGVIDLRGVTKDTQIEIKVPPVGGEESDSASKTTQERSEDTSGKTSSDQSTAPDPNVPICDPNVPRYTQPNCREVV